MRDDAKKRFGWFVRLFFPNPCSARGSSGGLGAACRSGTSGVSRDADLEYLGPSHPDFELKRSTQFVVQFKGERPEAVYHALRMRRLPSMDRSA